MVRAARRKRASEDDLYRGCLRGQDCPIDIKNKYEQNTIADRILKWVSSFLYFGTLGIGTGRGSGGTGGYTRLGGGGVRGGQGANVARPNVIVDAIGPTAVPIDPVTPDSAIIPLLESSGNSVTTDIAGTPGAGEIEVIAEIHPPPTTNEPAIVIGDTENPPVLEVTPETHPTSRVRSSTSKHDNPAFNAFVSSSQLPGETSASDNVYVMHGFNGEFIGAGTDNTVFEEIPLEEFTAPESPPTTSTPDSRFRSVLNRFQRRLYNRRLVQQVKITDRTFLTQPSQLVRWEFENPAFADDSVSLLFQQDIDEVAAAPNPEFQDVVKLSRPIISEYNGQIRVSRLGQRGTIRTRSGLQIGSHVHYYSDISPVRPAEDIEMVSFGETSADSVIMQPLEESTIIDSTPDEVNVGLLESYADSDLQDFYEEDFSHTRLEVSTTGNRTSIITVPDSLPPGAVKIFVNDYESTVHHNPNSHYDPSIIPINPLTPGTPEIIIDIYDNAATFYLHPSLLRKFKRKNKLF